jgi:DMSO/TMAO reductase YedYZ molybdopterin-dependent catalytic subunit
MNAQRRHVLSGILAIGPAVLMSRLAIGQTQTFTTDTLKVSGRVINPATLDVAALRQMPAKALPATALTNHGGQVLRTLTGYTGVLLKDVLDAAVIESHGRDDLKKIIIVATASDEYKAVFSWNEIYNTEIGEGVMVLYAHDGQPLADAEGHIALISAKDLHTGPRFVRWLQSINVEQVA